MSNASSKIIENCVKRSMEEMEARTADVVQLKLVILSRDKTTVNHFNYIYCRCVYI